MEEDLSKLGYDAPSIEQLHPVVRNVCTIVMYFVLIFLNFVVD
jgi:hypothetical protein